MKNNNHFYNRNFYLFKKVVKTVIILSILSKRLFSYRLLLYILYNRVIKGRKGVPYGNGLARCLLRLLYTSKERTVGIIYLFPEPKSYISKMVREVRETRFSKGLACVHCGSMSIKRSGKYRSRQRYLCKDCGKSFNDMTGSPL